MSIRNECMVVNLQIGIWAGHKLDKEASQKVTQDAGAATGAARVNKHLIPQDALQPILTAASAMRNHFYTQTLPWKDNGDRLLPRKMFTKFADRHGELKSQFDSAVIKFVTDTYMKARDQAEFRMGDLFKEADYPEPRTIVARFYANMDIDSITDSKDFRVKLEDDDANAIKANLDAAVSSRMNKAMLEVWERLAKVVGNFADRVGGEGRLRQEVFDNLDEIVTTLPDMNFGDDANLEAIRARISTTLLGYSPKDIKDDTKARSEIGAEAKKIMEEMSGFMKAFG